MPQYGDYTIDKVIKEYREKEWPTKYCGFKLTPADIRDILEKTQDDTRMYFHANDPIILRDFKRIMREKREEAIERNKLTGKRRKNVDTKPDGSWFSMGADFFKFEITENFYMLSCFKYIYEIVLKKSAKLTYNIEDAGKGAILIILNDVRSHRQFAKKYYKSKYYMKDDSLYHDFSGVIFKDYNKRGAFSLSKKDDYPHYYFMIDGESGCIWNEDVIANIVLIHAISA
jgi:hypothetical protein